MPAADDDDKKALLEDSLARGVSPAEKPEEPAEQGSAPTLEPAPEAPADGSAGGDAGEAPTPPAAKAAAAAAEPAVQTLAGQDPEAAARHAHQQRKLLMKEKKKSRVMGNFLSNVGEIDVDVSYRFTFTVVGMQATQIIETICNSGHALKMGGALSTKHGKDQMYRCMCEVTDCTGALGPAALGTKKAVAKLAFHARSFDESPPPCTTRQDMLSNAIVYALDIAATSEDGESTFPEQLEKYLAALARLRVDCPKRRLRPVKALLLYSSSRDGTVPKSGLEAWALELADFEQEHGDTWKFGPVALQEDDMLHEIFAEMTAARLVHTKKEEDAPQEPEEPEQDDGGELTFTPSAGHNASRHVDRNMSSGSSSVSEQERPPCFDAEMSGSECSEGALELHARTFGLSAEEVAQIAAHPAGTNLTE